MKNSCKVEKYITMDNNSNNETYTLHRVNANTQKADIINSNFFNTDEHIKELYQIYGNYSTAKQKALEYCKRLEYAFNGRHGHICSYNCDFFSYTFEFDNPNDGVCEIALITAYNNYYTDMK